MRIFFFKFGQSLALLILGLLMGASLVNWQLGHQLDQLHQVKDQLKQEIEDKNIRLAQLENSLAQMEGQKYTVKSVEVHVTLAKKDEFIQLELEKQVKEMLIDLVGREVKDLDPLTIPAIIHKRKIPVEEDEYSLEVTNTIISERIIIYLKATKETKAILQPQAGSN